MRTPKPKWYCPLPPPPLSNTPFAPIDLDSIEPHRLAQWCNPNNKFKIKRSTKLEIDAIDRIAHWIRTGCYMYFVFGDGSVGRILIDISTTGKSAMMYGDMVAYGTGDGLIVYGEPPHTIAACLGDALEATGGSVSKQMVFDLVGHRELLTFLHRSAHAKEEKLYKGFIKLSKITRRFPDYYHVDDRFRVGVINL